MNTQLEQEVIKRFVRKEKQSRYNQFISSIKNRKKFLNELPHFKDFKSALFAEVTVNEREIILGQLKLIKGDRRTCYIISESSAIDQRQFPVEDAILFLNSGLAMILVFGQAEMIYYEGEPLNNKLISKL